MRDVNNNYIQHLDTNDPDMQESIEAEFCEVCCNFSGIKDECEVCGEAYCDECSGDYPGHSLCCWCADNKYIMEEREKESK